MLQLKGDDRSIACAREKRKSYKGAVPQLDFRCHRDRFDHRPNLIDGWARLISAGGSDAGQIVRRVKVLDVSGIDSRAIAAQLREPRKESLQRRERRINGRGRQGLAGSLTSGGTQVCLEPARLFDVEFLEVPMFGDSSKRWIAFAAPSMEASSRPLTSLR